MPKLLIILLSDEVNKAIEMYKARNDVHNKPDAINLILCKQFHIKYDLKMKQFGKDIEDDDDEDD